MLHKLLLMASLLALTASPVLGSNVYGNLTLEDGKPGQAIEVEIKCPEKTYKGRTNSRGSYNIYVEHQGRCSLRLTFNGQPLKAPVLSLDDPVRHNFEIVKTASGKYDLRRR
ncbi:MAG: hypothetical protein AAF604_15335 [Acidobacteriota bacterium]